MEDRLVLKREKEWIENYIPRLEKEKIVFEVFEANEFYDFLEENYLVDGSFLGFPDAETGEWIPFGLTNTSFSLEHSYHYLVSYMENKKGKKTILTCLCYILDFTSLEVPDQSITFLSYIETNYFYQGQGLFKATLKKFATLPSLHPYLLVTSPSYDGILCHTIDTLKEVMKEKGVQVFPNIYELKDAINKKLTK